MVFSGIFSLAVGVLMIGQWTVTLLRKQVAGPDAGISGRGKLEMAFHYVAEFTTALLMIVAGIGLLTGTEWGRVLFFVSIGMLIYTVINSPGYFAQKGQWPAVLMFALLLVLAVFSLILVI
jgi:hypothetical protein